MKILRYGMLCADESKINICGYKIDAEGERLEEGREIVKTVLEYLLKATENGWNDLNFTCIEIINAQERPQLP